jgi:hypothetical protein
VLGRIPLDHAALIAAEQGTPVVRHAPSSAAAVALRVAGDALMQRLDL